MLWFGVWGHGILIRGSGNHDLAKLWLNLESGYRCCMSTDACRKYYTIEHYYLILVLSIN